MAKLYPTNPVLILATALAGGSLVLGLWSWQQWMRTTAGYGQQEQVQSATVLPEARPLPQLTLVDDNGQQRQTTALTDNWSLWFFGFTNCPDVCPNTLAMLAAVKQSLAKEAPGRELQIVFVSVDPNRDTPVKLHDYVQYFDPDFLGLTGSREAIDQLTGAIYLPYSIDEPGKNGSYNVEHSGALVLVDPEAAVRAYFSPPHNRKQLVRDLQLLTKGSGS